MKARAEILWVALIFLCAASGARADENDICRDRSESLRTDTLTEMHRIDENFRDAHWFYRKTHEIIYGPLWEAEHNRREAYQGNARRGEAETLYNRYRILADQMKEQADAALDRTLEGIHKAKKGLPFENLCGASHMPEDEKDAISLFNNCTAIWDAESAELFGVLTAAVKDYEKKIEDFHSRVEAHLKDTGSDHSNFTEAYKNGFLDFESDNQSIFLGTLQKLTDRFQYSYPADKCCAVCSQDKRLHWDPVLTQVKLDPQGDAGVTGQVVNNARLLPAFKKMEEASKKENDERNK